MYRGLRKEQHQTSQRKLKDQWRTVFKIFSENNFPVWTAICLSQIINYKSSIKTFSDKQSTKKISSHVFFFIMKEQTKKRRKYEVQHRRGGQGKSYEDSYGETQSIMNQDRKLKKEEKGGKRPELVSLKTQKILKGMWQRWSS